MHVSLLRMAATLFLAMILGELKSSKMKSEPPLSSLIQGMFPVLCINYDDCYV